MVVVSEAASNISALLRQYSGLLPSVAFGCSTIAAFSVRMVKAVRRPRVDRQPQDMATVDFLLRGRDPLTKLDDYDSLRGAVTGRLAARAPAALFMLRLDNLQEIIADHGHRAGECVLVAVADRLRKLWPTERWSRLIGDDLGSVLGSVEGAAQLEAAALVILRSVEEPILTFEGELVCKASLGITRIPGQAARCDADAGTTILAALSAVRKASAAGGSQWMLFDLEQQRAEILRDSVKEELRVAIETGQIIPYYQPIVDLRTGDIVGLEVLARWEHPTRGVLPPDLFIPLAEEMKVAGLVSQTLMRRVIADARYWPNSLYFAFNASPGQLRELINFIKVPPSWPEGSLDPRRLEIEITESALIEDLEVARSVIELLQAAGTRVVLDDFGIGYSNFFHLRELPFDKIKIDKSFVLDLGLDPRADACVRTMIALGKSLDIEMVAEGVEKGRIANYVADLGCRYGQGYLYSAPVSADAVSVLLRNPAKASPLSLVG